MSQNIPAVYHAGVFHPLEPVDWPEGTRAQVTPVSGSAAPPDTGPQKKWPDGYFERTSGALAGERFERPPQPPFPQREDW
jgi:hypothetical protein